MKTSIAGGANPHTGYKRLQRESSEDLIDLVSPACQLAGLVANRLRCLRTSIQLLLQQEREPYRCFCDLFAGSLLGPFLVCCCQTENVDRPAGVRSPELRRELEAGSFGRTREIINNGLRNFE